MDAAPLVALVCSACGVPLEAAAAQGNASSWNETVGLDRLRGR